MTSLPAMPCQEEAIRVGEHADRFLTSRYGNGQVVSAFRGGLCILFDDETPSHLLTIHDRTIPLSPWSLEVEYPPDVPLHTKVRSTPSDLQIGGLSTIRHAAAVRTPLRIRPANETLPLSELQRRFALGRRAASDGSPEGVPVWLPWTLATWAVEGDDSVFLPLIGRGVGSTPAGDDALVGLIAAFSLRRDGAEVVTRIAAMLQDRDLERRTSTGSAQMLRAAIEGSFPEPLCALSEALAARVHQEARLSDAIRAMAALGATSGHMMLCGFSCGLSPIPRRRSAGPVPGNDS